MRHRLRHLILACASLLLVAHVEAVTIGRLQVENQDRPLGVDAERPRFSWVLHAAERAQRQSAYRIMIASSAHELASGRGDVWDSGKVCSADNFGIEYAGPPLRSDTRYFWTVRVWDGADHASAWSEPSWWHTGLMEAAVWKARRIGGDADSPLLRHSFSLSKPVLRATAYVYAVGWYRLWLNGAELTDRVLAPVNSNYPRALFYDTYDVTPRLQRGVNGVGVWLGHGYGATYSQYGYRWAGPPAALAQLEIVFVDGTTQAVVTDGEWKTTESPILANDLYHGETYDARREIAGWSRGDFDDRNWAPVSLRPAPAAPLRSCPFPGLAVAADLRPVKLTEPAPGTFIFDLGQNIAGWARLRADGPAGTRIRLRHAEELRADGTLDPSTNRNARATDSFILKGRGEEVYEPRFTYHGFRYVEVTGYPGRPSLESLTGRAVHAAVADAGTFRCSDPLLNRLHENFRWTIANNLMGIPTDTAVRDERTPCQMDSLAVEDAAICNFDLAAYYSKWLQDISGDGGSLPNWTGDQVVLPFLLYENYGDRRVLERHFENMKQVVERLAAAAEANRYWADGFGDWAAPNRTGSYETSFSEGALVNSAFLCRTARIVAEAAGILGRPADAVRFGRLAADLRAAFETRFYHPDTATYGSGRQVTSVLPLAFDLVPAARRPAVAAALRHRLLEVDHGHLDTGIFGTRYLFDVLIDSGLADLALQVLTAPGYPGYADQIAQGATTTWEQWSFRGGMQTHDHAMFSGPDATFFSRLGGIQPAAPGFREILIQPTMPAALSFVACSRQTPMGKISSEWHRTANGVALRLHVPVNATAYVHLPASPGADVRESGQPARTVAGVRAVQPGASGIVLTVGSGDYDFTVPTNPPPSS